MGDRQGAHYYRAQHARAVERAGQWEHKTRASEKIIAQLLVLLGCLVKRIAELSRQLAWLRKQQFGRKSETSKNSESGSSTSNGAAESDAADSSRTPTDPADQRAAAAKSKTGGRRGQQRGGKGPKRQRRGNLPEQVINHTLEESGRTCGVCGKVHPQLAMWEESQEVGWEVRLVRRVHRRFRYGPSCQCPGGRSMPTAPKPAKLIPKGLFAVDFWVQVLLKKFEFAQPIQRTIRELQAHGLHVSPGTLSGGLEKIGAMVQPLAGQFVLHSREGAHWHMDETRWPMFCLPESKSRNMWWLWVVVSQDVTAFLLEPSRAGKVPRDFFPKGTQGIVSVDRYTGYWGLLGSDWLLKLAFCWSHQRRDFIPLVESSKGTPAGIWAREWVELIDRLFRINAQRREAWFKGETVLFVPLDMEVRRQVEHMQERRDLELASGKLQGEPEKILRSLRRHWTGLRVFVEHPWVPMDNNAAERANRAAAVARKNFYGSGSEWSGELACACFTILATLRQHGLCPRRYFQAYLEACANHGGRAPENLEEFLPWKWDPEKKAAWRTQEHPP